ncbi:MAG: ATPase [Chloroflexota bacterium]
MPDERQLTILCLASYYKGDDFLRECKKQGCRVLLLTVDRLSECTWPHSSIDEIFTLPDLTDRQAVINTVAWIARTREIDRIVPLDDYDVETAAMLREHLRIPGMGDTTARYFRDKLAMRVQARDRYILVPPFVPVVNHAKLAQFMEQVPAPWVLKPRSEAAAAGIRRLQQAEEIWPLLEALGDRQSYFVLEQYIPGDVYHIDAVVYEREILFAEAHRYGSPPLNVAHDGGIFTSITLPHDSPDMQTLQSLHSEVLRALNFVRGVTHTEFIKSREDGRFYFLETAARVGGAYLMELLKASTGLNLWAEWARIEIAGGERAYELPQHKQDYGGIIISLARQEHPDTSAYDDPEIAWRLDQRHHAGLVVTSPDHERVQELVNSYIPRFYADYYATEPPLDKPLD